MEGWIHNLCTHAHGGAQARRDAARHPQQRSGSTRACDAMRCDLSQLTHPHTAPAVTPRARSNRARARAVDERFVVRAVPPAARASGFRRQFARPCPARCLPSLQVCDVLSRQNRGLKSDGCCQLAARELAYALLAHLQWAPKPHGCATCAWASGRLAVRLAHTCYFCAPCTHPGGLGGVLGGPPARQAQRRA
jgi:hypothetical protein